MGYESGHEDLYGSTLCAVYSLAIGTISLGHMGSEGPGAAGSPHICAGYQIPLHKDAAAGGARSGSGLLYRDPGTL